MTTNTVKLDQSHWHDYFDKISRTLEGKQAEIEVDSLALGAQIQAQWVPMLGVVYEPKTGVIEIVLEGLDHLIHQPREVYVEHDATGLCSLEVIDDDGTRQIIKLREPVLLPAPAATRA